jgi:type II secretory pathway predicted ATPase ExeA
MNLNLDAVLARYGLRVNPFQPGADPAFLWLGPGPREILDRLKAGILAGERVLVLTGDVGTGKSLLAKALLGSLGPEVLCATLMYTRAEPLELLKEIGDAWGIGSWDATAEAFYARLEPFLADLGARGRRALLLIDEAQTLSGELFAEIGRLASVGGETGPSQAGPSILLVGQLELDAILSKPENAALEKRLSIKCTTVPLREGEVREYVSHRLRFAGADQPVFTADGFREIAVCSQGIPRLINMLGDLALIQGARRNAPTIDAAIVRDCARLLKQPLPSLDRSGARADDAAGWKSSSTWLAVPGRRASDAIARLGRRQHPVARPEPAPDGEAGLPPVPAEATATAPPAARLPAPAEPDATVDAADAAPLGQGRDPGAADGPRDPTPRRAGPPDPVEPAPAAGRIPPSGGEGTQGRYRLLGPPVDTPGGQAYAAEQLASGRRLVLHALRGTAAEDPAAVGRFRRRVELTMDVSPHVLPLEDHGRLDDGRLFVVSARLEASSLEDLLREEGPLPVARALSLAKQIGEGLEAAHRVGLFHDRLDASWVMVTDPPERVVLTGWEGDVGSAPVGNDSGLPEDWSRRGVAREQRDVVAFAALLYQMVAGIAPFGDGEPNASARRPRPLVRWRRQMPPRLGRLVMRVLDRRAGQRQDLGSLLHALEVERVRLESGELRSGPSRRWRIAAGIVLLAAAVLATLAWWAVEVRRSGPVIEPPTVARPLPPAPTPEPAPRPTEQQASTPAPGSAIRTAGPPVPSPAPEQPVQGQAVPVPPKAMEPPSAPPRVPPARPGASPPVRPQPAGQSGSADATRSGEPTRPGDTAPPASSREGDAEPDPGAIIDWVLRNR